MINKLNQPKYYLLLANIFLVIFLIFANNLKIIPLKTSDFVFFTLITFAFALWRPGWAYLLFIGTLPLENINLAPESLGIMIRPYQFLGAVVILALFFRKILGRAKFIQCKFGISDFLAILVLVGSLISGFGATDKTINFKLSVILASFVALYFLTRIFIQNLGDLKKILPFFLSSSGVIVIYGIWQNIRFSQGLTNFEVMPGRPNATFSEPDWLGMFLMLMISACCSLAYYLSVVNSKNNQKIFNYQLSIFNKFPISKFQILNYFIFLASLILLMITVSRSAWLGAFFSLIVFLFFVLTELKWKNWRWKETLRLKLFIISAFIVSLGAVYVFNLTDFQLLNRAKSAGSGLQKITISCNLTKSDFVRLPEKIEDVSELEAYGCRHINLEEIEKEKSSGNFVTEIYRSDPNINIRSGIYRKSWEEIKKNPILGIGWGSIGKILGKDGRGTTLNSSNIILETWLGAGLIGIMALILLLILSLKGSLVDFKKSEEIESKTTALFIITALVGIIVANLFNAGMFLGFFWVFLAIANCEIDNVT